MDTELGRHVEKKWYGKVFFPIVKMTSKTPLQGAQTTLFCVLEDSIAKDSGNYYSDCKEKRPHSRARKVEDQKKLWQISEELVGHKSSY